MSRCIIFLNGVMSNYTFFTIKKDDFIIAADGGMRHAMEMTKHVNLWLGDFDSFDESKLPSDIAVDEIRRFNVDKNFTDGELTIQEARKGNYDEIIILGAMGRRRDHELANFMMLFSNLTVRIESEREVIYPLQGSVTCEGDGRTISIIPLSDSINVTIEGVKFPLEKHTVKFGSSHTMSNVIKGKEAVITCHQGKALLIVNKMLEEVD